MLGLVGLLVSGFGILLDARQAYFSYLAAYVTGLSLVLGALLTLMLSHLTGATWFAPLRRQAEAVACTTPLFALLFLPLVSGMHQLYPWVPPVAVMDSTLLKSIQDKRAWLNPSFFLIRTGMYFTVWIGVSLLLRRWSVRMVPGTAARNRARQRALSAGGLPAVALALTFAAFDWMMSLSPEWSSTIYGAYVFGGGLLAALSLFAASAPRAERAGLLEREIPVDSYHSLGKLLLTFVIFWAYLGFCQLLIIWIADIPREVSWYVRRLHGSWGLLAGLLLLGNFVGPFLLLLFREAKRSAGTLAIIGLWLLVMHYLDVYWLIMPQLHADGVRVHWLDLTTLVGVGGVALAYGAWQLRREAVVRAKLGGLALVAMLGACRTPSTSDSIPGGNPRQGKAEIVAFGCSSCHTIPGIPQATGMVGPPLEHFAGRAYIAGQVPNTGEWLIKWIMVPQSIEPGTAMPNLGVTERQARDMAAYLYTLH
jgi:cytochrome c2